MPVALVCLQVYLSLYLYLYLFAVSWDGPVK
jgi:hypothetical protein